MFVEGAHDCCPSLLLRGDCGACLALSSPVLFFLQLVLVGCLGAKVNVHSPFSHFKKPIASNAASSSGAACDKGVR